MSKILRLSGHLFPFFQKKRRILNDSQMLIAGRLLKSLKNPNFSVIDEFVKQNLVGGQMRANPIF